MASRLHSDMRAFITSVRKRRMAVDFELAAFPNGKVLFDTATSQAIDDHERLKGR